MLWSLDGPSLTQCFDFWRFRVLFLTFDYLCIIVLYSVLLTLWGFIMVLRLCCSFVFPICSGLSLCFVIFCLCIKLECLLSGLSVGHFVFYFDSLSFCVRWVPFCFPCLFSLLLVSALFLSVAFSLIIPCMHTLSDSASVLFHVFPLCVHSCSLFPPSTGVCNL